MYIWYVDSLLLLMHVKDTLCIVCWYTMYWPSCSVIAQHCAKSLCMPNTEVKYVVNEWISDCHMLHMPHCTNAGVRATMT
jgi:hypothetical protein